MTLKEKVMQMHPDVQIFDGDSSLTCPDYYLPECKDNPERQWYCHKGECVRCWNMEYVQPHSNYERIKKMNIYELATFLNEWAERPLAWQRDIGETKEWLGSEARD